jgi:death-on-curing protein
VTRYVTLEQGLRIARAAVGGPVQVRDLGLLEAALLRPQTSLFGHDAYRDLFVKAAALLHSIVTNHPLVDGNKRAGWLTTYVFLAKNGIEFDPDDDEAYDFVIAIAAGKLTEVDEMADVLRTFTTPS